jgi:hypothetical protein
MACNMYALRTYFLQLVRFYVCMHAQYSNHVKMDSVTCYVLAAPTHVKISHLLASLSTSRQLQVVFALLVASCQHLLTTCNDLAAELSDLLQDPLQGCSDKPVTFLSFLDITNYYNLLLTTL